jgi:hypothetical protein
MFSWHKGRTTRLRQEVSANGFDYSPLECARSALPSTGPERHFRESRFRSTALERGDDVSRRGTREVIGSFWGPVGLIADNALGPPFR